MVQIKIKTFGKITEILNTDVLELKFEGTNEDLTNLLCEGYPPLKKLKFTLAINRSIPVGVVYLKDGDEIALLPPFSGG